MKLKKILLLFVIAITGVARAGAQNMTPEEYIDTYKEFAIREMKRMGVPAAITLAQGLLETENGNSMLLKKSNNHFGIKCKSNWTAGGVSHDDDAPGECFRSYKNAEESYRDHSNFLRNSDRYAFLFKLDPTDYKGWAYGLKKAGYATNPKYPLILIKSIEQFNLQQYSLQGAKDVPVFQPEKFKDDPVSYDANQKIEGDYNKEQAPVEAAPLISDELKAENASISNVTSVNGSKCVFAPKGTSLLAIASMHNINLKKLLDYNDLEEDGLLEQPQLIFLQRKATKGEKAFYILSKKESYYDIAQKNGVQLQAVLDFNKAEEDVEVNAGTKVYLQDAQGNAPVTVKEKGSRRRDEEKHEPKLYEVQPKEGLYSIARKYNVTVQQLREWNNLSSDNLKVGQQLIVGK